MKQLLIEYNGKQHLVIAQKLQGKLWIHLDGKTFSWMPEKKRTSQLEGTLHDTEVRAPMPGKITKTHFTSGQDVKSGQIVVVMEAMKMEYSLKAAIDGKIKYFKCQEGDQVGLNQLLVEIEAH